MKTDEAGAVSSRTLVLEAIVQLHDAGQEPTRERVAQLTGLRMTTVDDRIKLLRAEGKIAARRQCYRPTFSHGPARPISVTFLAADGLVKLEWGDCVETLTQTEAACLGQQLMGWATQATALGRVNQLQDDVLRLAGSLRKLENDNKALRKKLRQVQQPCLEGFLEGLTALHKNGAYDDASAVDGI